MKGIEINYNGKITCVAADSGMTTISIDCVRDNGTVYVCNVDYETQMRNIWYDFSPLVLGDKIEIRMVNIEQISEPIKSQMDEDIKQPMSKLEHFLRLEAHLKKEGLL